jgi:hypothetical protein
VQPAVRPGYEEYLNGIPEGDRRLGQNYPLMLEPLSADPPLSPDVAQWVANKKERRRGFAEGCKEVNYKFHRVPACGSKWDYRLKTITSHSLDGRLWLPGLIKSLISLLGAYFAHEAE